MSSDAILRVQGIGKSFRVYRRPVDRLIEWSTAGLVRRHSVHRALEDVRFEIKAGESVALLGGNGSGKSTLLQILAGTMTPSRGRAVVGGKLTALLELGAGFIGEVSGRENAILASRLYGMTEDQAKERLGWISEFSGIGDRIDSPVKFYSSGMFSRLAFAVAVAARPDIILIDEALSVGDAAFQRKAEEHLRGELGDAAKLIVSHDLDAVRRSCDRAVLIRNGKIAFDGEVEEAISLLSSWSGSEVEAKGSREIKVASIAMAVSGSASNGARPGDNVTIGIDLERETVTSPSVIEIILQDGGGRAVVGMTTEDCGVREVPKGRSRLVVDFACPPLRAGEYRVRVRCLVDDRKGIRSLAYDGLHNESLSCHNPLQGHSFVLPASAMRIE